MKASIFCLNWIILFYVLVVIVCSAQQRIDRATKHKVKKAIDNIVGVFVEEEERNSESENSFGCLEFFPLCHLLFVFLCQILHPVHLCEQAAL